MKKSLKNDQGFTLIELLVVVAIISLLSSIVFASLNSARAKAKDSAIMQEFLQYRNLLELNKSETGSYAELQNTQRQTWFNNTADCDDPTAFDVPVGGNYQDQARAICKNIVKLSFNSSNPYPMYTLHLGLWSAPVTTVNYYSLMAYLPYKDKYLCVGTSGISEAPFDQYLNTTIGCASNP